MYSFLNDHKKLGRVMNHAMLGQKCLRKINKVTYFFAKQLKSSKLFMTEDTGDDKKEAKMEERG